MLLVHIPYDIISKWIGIIHIIYMFIFQERVCKCSEYKEEAILIFAESEYMFHIQRTSRTFRIMRYAAIGYCLSRGRIDYFAHMPFASLQLIRESKDELCRGQFVYTLWGMCLENSKYYSPYVICQHIGVPKVPIVKICQLNSLNKRYKDQWYTYCYKTEQLNKQVFSLVVLLIWLERDYFYLRSREEEIYIRRRCSLDANVYVLFILCCLYMTYVITDYMNVTSIEDVQIYIGLWNVL